MSRKNRSKAKTAARKARNARVVPDLLARAPAPAPREAPFRKGFSTRGWDFSVVGVSPPIPFDESETAPRGLREAALSLVLLDPGAKPGASN